jgi:ABC-2 type transport system permease protein
MTTGDATMLRDADRPVGTAGRTVSPAWTVACKEWTELARDARWKALIGVTLLLMLASLALGLLRLQRLERDHHAATEGDRRVWTAQGTKNPHSAAHFGQYAFKPVGPLAVADPGADEFAGNAVWLEAHRQNEAQFRTARDGTLAARMGRLTLAFVLQAVLPLMAILLGFAAFSGEREAGTLPQLMSLGVRPRDLLLGKGLAGGVVLLGLLALAVAGLGLGLAAFGPGDAAEAGEGVRLAGMFAAYAVYLAGFLALSLAASARARSSRSALVMLLGFWLVNVFIAPRLAADLVRRADPLPTAQEFRAAMAEAKRAQFGHDESHPGFIAFRDRVLKQYGVARVEDLPVSFRGLSLREDDEAGYRIFDEHFGRLSGRIDRQDRMRAAAGVVFPLLALQPVSMAMAGTDNRHHDAFVQAAERHRRMIQTAASQDLIEHARNGDLAYKASADLWEKIPAFHFERPAAGTVFASQAANFGMLAFWCLGCVTLAWASAARPRLARKD